jgi:methionyl-tRNA synthetase
LAETEPWKLAKTDPERVKTILNIAIQITGSLSILLDPFIPGTAKKMRDFLNVEKADWSKAGDIDFIPSGMKANKPTILFQKIDDAFVENEQALLQATKTEEMTAEPQKEAIEFDEFMKMDLRVGQILEAKKVKKADKLLELKVDTGLDQRTIVSGIAQHYSPEDIVGTKVTVLMNLPPRKIRGVVSQGMILMAEDKEGVLSFMVPDKDLEVGSEIR